MPLFGRKKKEEVRAPPPNPAEEQFQKALALSNQELHSDALMAFRRVLELDPAFQPDIVHYGMALAYDGMGMDAQAVEELLAVLARNPAHIEARIVLGTIFARQNRYEEAIAEYENALAIKPAHELADEMRRSIDQWRMGTSGGALEKLRQDLQLFIDQAEGQFGVKLDYTPQSLGTMDRLIDAGWNLQSGGIGVLRLAGTYVGEVIVRNLGGQWRLAQPPEESDISGLGKEGVRPFFIALEKFQKARAGSLQGSYQRLAAELGGATG